MRLADVETALQMLDTFEQAFSGDPGLCVLFLHV
jgi:hypothetical protein